MSEDEKDRLEYEKMMSIVDKYSDLLVPCPKSLYLKNL
jgi:hypothetical protein